MNKYEEILKYKDFPEGSGSKKMYDKYFLPFNEYLEKYYSNPIFSEWNNWYKSYIEPAFDENRHDEMIRNFGYISKDKHDFVTQYEVFFQLNKSEELDKEFTEFIGFIAGMGFFKKYDLTINQWLNIKNWQNPYLEVDEDGKTIIQILSYPYGLNYIKMLFTQMPFWKR